MLLEYTCLEYIPPWAQHTNLRRHENYESKLLPHHLELDSQTKAIIPRSNIFILSITNTSLNSWYLGFVENLDLYKCNSGYKSKYYSAYVHTCCSISPFSGLNTTPIALSLFASGARNMHMVFPEPVAIRMKTSWPCRTERDASNCPGRKVECPKYLHSTVFSFKWHGHLSFPP